MEVVKSRKDEPFYPVVFQSSRKHLLHVLRIRNHFESRREKQLCVRNRVNRGQISGYFRSPLGDPIRHTEDFFSRAESDWNDANQLLRVLQGRIKAEDTEVEGFNIGANCGETSGQTVGQAHIHLIPRRKGTWPIREEGFEE